MLTIEVDSKTKLRQVRSEYVEAIAETVLRNYEHLYEWLPWVNEEFSVEVAARFVRRSEKQFAEGSGLQTVIFRGKEVCGVTGFNVIDKADDSAEIGYWLAKTCEGQGLMSSCCRALIDYGFDEFGFNRIMIRCATENTRSQAIPLRLGFTAEGVLREAEKLHGKYVDLKVFSLLKSERE